MDGRLESSGHNGWKHPLLGPKAAAPAMAPLVSAAALLDAGDFIGLMAGKTVFRLAQCKPAAFLLLAGLQGWLARVSPGLLFRMLFANAAGEDKALATDKAFRSAIAQALKMCFSRHPQAYVQPWQGSLPNITANTTVWHRAEDNWSPVAMAAYLASALPNCSKFGDRFAINPAFIGALKQRPMHLTGADAEGHK